MGTLVASVPQSIFLSEFHQSFCLLGIVWSMSNDIHAVHQELWNTFQFYLSVYKILSNKQMLLCLYSDKFYFSLISKAKVVYIRNKVMSA